MIYTASNELADLYQSILQCVSLADFQTVQKTVKMLGSLPPAATPEPGAPTPAPEPDRSRMYKVGDQWWPYPHGMTEEEWNRKIGTPSYEHVKDMPED